MVDKLSMYKLMYSYIFYGSTFVLTRYIHDNGNRNYCIRWKVCGKKMQSTSNLLALEQIWLRKLDLCCFYSLLIWLVDTLDGLIQKKWSVTNSSENNHINWDIVQTFIRNKQLSLAYNSTRNPSPHLGSGAKNQSA